MVITKEILDELTEKAKANPRLRANLDLRNSAEDGSQRMLNALEPVYKNAPAYLNGVSEAIFKVGMCLPAGPYVSDDDVKYIVETIKHAIA